jgi:hypothetical protein
MRAPPASDGQSQGQNGGGVHTGSGNSGADGGDIHAPQVEENFVIRTSNESSCPCAKVCAHGDKTSVRFRTTARSPTNRACRKINAGHVMSIPHATDAQRNTKHAAIPSAVRAV